MNLIFTHGEKGGVGKSTAAKMILSRAIECGMNPYLIEGDSGIPDVLDAYRGHVNGFSIPLNRPDMATEAMGALMQHVEQNHQALRGRPIVLNLPAGAGATVDAMAVEVADVCRALDATITTVFLVAPGPDSLRTAKQSLEAGIAGVSNIRIAALNAHLEKPEQMEWVGSSTQSEWLAGGLEFVLQPLAARVSTAIRPLRGPLFSLAAGEGDGKEIFLFDRSALRRWLVECRPLADAALGVEDDNDTKEAA